MKRKIITTTALSLPETIIHEEILSRLPVKSLLRFRCVSKSWGSLIDSKRFIKINHQNSMQNPSFPHQRAILRNKGYYSLVQCSLQTLLSEEPIDIKTNTSSPKYEVLGCYNGLVCIHKYDRRFYLWNPSTRISKQLPEISNRKFYFENCGFGWDESSGEYKVFASKHDRGRVYSSKTKSWKKIKADIHCWKEVGVFVGGKLHWRNTESINDIVFLDLESEVFGRIELPFDQKNWYGTRLGQIGGCLCVLYYDLRRDIRVWVMKESWERLVDLSLDHELLQRPFSASFIQKGSNGEIFVFDGSTLLVYDTRDNVFRFREFCRPFASKRVTHHVYVESLLSPEDVLGTA